MSNSAEQGRDLERIARNIHPGGWAVEDDRPIATLLGSCVSVCLFEQHLRIGGLNHFMLPSSSRSKDSDFDELLCGDYAMEVLANALYERGAQKKRLVAKAFGGGDIVGSITMSIGKRNADFAREWLARENIPLVSSHFGGPYSRKLIFVPDSGDVFCKLIPNTLASSERVAREEADYALSLATPAPSKEKKIELF